MEEKNPKFMKKSSNVIASFYQNTSSESCIANEIADNLRNFATNGAPTISSNHSEENHEHKKFLLSHLCESNMNIDESGKYAGHGKNYSLGIIEAAHWLDKPHVSRSHSYQMPQNTENVEPSNLQSNYNSIRVNSFQDLNESSPNLFEGNTVSEFLSGNTVQANISPYHSSVVNGKHVMVNAAVPNILNQPASYDNMFSPVYMNSAITQQHSQDFPDEILTRNLPSSAFQPTGMDDPEAGRSIMNNGLNSASLIHSNRFASTGLSNIRLNAISNATPEIYFNDLRKVAMGQDTGAANSSNGNRMGPTAGGSRMCGQAQNHNNSLFNMHDIAAENIISRPRGRYPMSNNYQVGEQMTYHIGQQLVSTDGSVGIPANVQSTLASGYPHLTATTNSSRDSSSNTSLFGALGNSMNTSNPANGGMGANYSVFVPQIAAQPLVTIGQEFNFQTLNTPSLNPRDIVRYIPGHGYSMGYLGLGPSSQIFPYNSGLAGGTGNYVITDARNGLPGSNNSIIKATQATTQLLAHPPGNHIACQDAQSLPKQAAKRKSIMAHPESKDATIKISPASKANTSSAVSARTTVSQARVGVTTRSPPASLAYGSGFSASIRPRIMVPQAQVGLTVRSQATGSSYAVSKPIPTVPSGTLTHTSMRSRISASQADRNVISVPIKPNITTPRGRKKTGIPPLTSQKHAPKNYGKQTALADIKNHPLQVSPFPIKGDAKETSLRLIGQKCSLCNIDLAFTPARSTSSSQGPPMSAVMPCSHVFHVFCLEEVGCSTERIKDPACPLCG